MFPSALARSPPVAPPSSPVATTPPPSPVRPELSSLPLGAPPISSNPLRSPQNEPIWFFFPPLGVELIGKLPSITWELLGPWQSRGSLT